MRFWTENLLQQRFLVHSRKGRKDGENLQGILERKVDSAVRGEMVARQKLFEAEAEVEARNWGKRNSGFLFQEIHLEFESQRF